MSHAIKSYAAHAASGRLDLFSIDRRDPRADDVVIRILHCGVCHSDLHKVRNDWGHAHYPMVPGHEIIGQVTRVGENVTRFRVGDHVGVGCMVDSCHHCERCAEGLEQYCQNNPTQTYDDVDRIDGMRTQGGYAETIVVRQDFVLRIPSGLDLAGSAPLLCAGITMYSPLRHWQVKAGTRVGVIGLGGLGHMGLKLARAMGAEVTLFSRSPGKEADALRLGAHHVVLSTEPTQMRAVAGQFDLIIDTVPVRHDVNAYLPTLVSGGVMVLIGYFGALADLSTLPLINGRRSLAGSLIGGIAETQQMLDFCGQHGITSDIEVIRMDQINEAFVRLDAADVKYRFVIDMASLGSA